MILSLENLRGYHLRSKEDVFGRVRDILFEEETWTARWLVVDTGNWLPGRKVLLSPLSIDTVDHENECLEVNLSKQEVEKAPPLEEHAPVSREYEKTYFDQFQLPYYWAGGGLWGNPVHPYSLSPKLNEKENESGPDAADNEEVADKENVLRSGHELTKYRIFAGENALGYMEDLEIDTRNWSVQSFKFDTRKWLHGKTLHTGPEHIKSVNWKEQALYTHLNEQNVQAAREKAQKSSSENADNRHIHVRSLMEKQNEE